MALAISNQTEPQTRYHHVFPASAAAGPAIFAFTMASTYGVFDFSFPHPSSSSSSTTSVSTSTTTPASESPSCGFGFICRKRARPLADIDGDQSREEITKKRRLRLAFVTSRLSAPFASPPRNNVDRGNSKIAVWAKQRAVPTHQFRKMAILNRIKREAMALREAQQRQIEIARQQQIEKMMAAPPRRASKRLQSKKSAKQAKATLTEQDTVEPVVPVMKEYRKIAPDPNHTPMHRRPPTPPSEEELERQRKQRKRK